MNTTTTAKASSKVKFGTPPPGREPRYDWTAIAARLRARPGKWAQVFTNDRYSLVTSIYNGGTSALRKSKGFRLRTANNHDEEGRRHCDLWLMYDPDLDQGKDKQ